MKKIILSTVFALAALSLSAQGQGDFEAGFNAGLNVSNISTIDGEDSTDSRLSFNIGATGEYYFSDSWGLKAKLIFDNKGWKEDFFGEELDVRVSYVTLPVMANWHFGSNRNWYLNFGMYAGFLTSAELSSDESSSDDDIKDAFKSTDFGLAFGIGYKFRVSDTMKLFVEYDAQSGLSEIFEETVFDETVRNGRSSLNVGLLFDL